MNIFDNVWHVFNQLCFPVVKQYFRSFFLVPFTSLFISVRNAYIDRNRKKVYAKKKKK